MVVGSARAVENAAPCSRWCSWESAWRAPTFVRFPAKPPKGSSQEFPATKRSAAQQLVHRRCLISTPKQAGQLPRHWPQEPTDSDLEFFKACLHLNLTAR